MYVTQNVGIIKFGFDYLKVLDLFYKYITTLFLFVFVTNKHLPSVYVRV